MNPSTIASTPELSAVWTLICQMTHDCFKSHICFSSFVVLNLAQTQRSVPNVHSQTEPNQGASHLRCAPGYRHNDITVLIIGDENNRVILCPQSSLKFSHTQPKISLILFLHSPWTRSVGVQPESQIPSQYTFPKSKVECAENVLREPYLALLNLLVLLATCWPLGDTIRLLQ